MVELPHEKVAVDRVIVRLVPPVLRPVLGPEAIGQDDPDWTYAPVGRLLAYLEHSLQQGLQWVVFELNDTPLWTTVRRRCEEFLEALRRDGVLLGDAAEDAFFVKCGRDTMTQDDLDNGRLILQIGVAPVRPAEFVIFQIGLWTSIPPH